MALTGNEYIEIRARIQLDDYEVDGITIKTFAVAQDTAEYLDNIKISTITFYAHTITEIDDDR